MKEIIPRYYSYQIITGTSLIGIASNEDIVMVRKQLTHYSAMFIYLNVLLLSTYLSKTDLCVGVNDIKWL